MAKTELPTPEELRKLLRYEPDTGKLYWLERSAEFFEDGKRSAETACRCWNARHAGKEAFTADDGRGYRTGQIFNCLYLAHRVIWAMVHGAWPADQIDHINGVKDDNRLENLRSVTSGENSRNHPRRADNSSGVTGVTWRPNGSKWTAQISVNDRQVHLGVFIKKDDAVAARKAAEIKYGYHENHGRS